jgi:DNA-binding transcriptional regulator PaaX
MKKRAEKISRTILLLLEQAVEPVEASSLPFRASKFSRHLFAKEKKYTRPQVKRALDHLLKTGAIEKITQTDGSSLIALTEKGREKTVPLRLEMMVEKNPRHWDGKWRMILFDIPELRRKGRDALRHKLKELNCYKLQESVWIYPYECRQAVRHLSFHYQVAPYVHCAVVDTFDREDAARRFFGIKETALPYETKHKKETLEFHPRA